MGTGRRSGEQRNQATSSHELKNKRRSRRGKGINSREFAVSQGPGSVSLATGKQRRRRGGSSPAYGQAGSPASTGAHHGLAVAGDRWRCSRSSAVGLSRSQSRGLIAGEGGGWSPAAAGGRHGRCVGKSRPVARQRRLRLREADCAWEGGVGSRATQKVGPGRIDGKDMYPILSLRPI